MIIKIVIYLTILFEFTKKIQTIFKYYSIHTFSTTHKY